MAGMRGGVVTLFIGFLVVFLVAFTVGLYIGKQMGSGGVRVSRLEPEEGGLGEPFGAVSEEGSLEEESGVAGRKGEVPGSESKPPVVRGEPSESSGAYEEESTSSIGAALEEMARTERESASKPSPKPTVEPPAKKELASRPLIDYSGKYTVQVASFPQEAKAVKLTNELMAKGYPAFMKSAQIAGRGTWYRVRVGSFKTRADARRYGEALKSREPGVRDVFITHKD